MTACGRAGRDRPARTRAGSAGPCRPWRSRSSASFAFSAAAAVAFSSPAGFGAVADFGAAGAPALGASEGAVGSDAGVLAAAVVPAFGFAARGLAALPAFGFGAGRTPRRPAVGRGPADAGRASDADAAGVAAVGATPSAASAVAVGADAEAAGVAAVPSRRRGRLRLRGRAATSASSRPPASRPFRPSASPPGPAWRRSPSRPCRPSASTRSPTSARRSWPPRRARLAACSCRTHACARCASRSGRGCPSWSRRRAARAPGSRRGCQACRR